MGEVWAMQIKFDLRKSVQENAAYYYELGKKARKKAEGVEKALSETMKKIKREGKKAAAKEEKAARPKVRVVREREWYEGFGWSFSGSGLMMLFGRNAKQNDLVVSRHMQDGDLFFHADIKGGSALVLKKNGGMETKEEKGEQEDAIGGGEEISAQDKEEAARIAVSFSSAWGKGFSQADSYCVGKEQLGKHASGGYVGAGGFAILGKREWFRNVPLKIAVGLDSKGRVAVGAPGAKWMSKALLLVPGKKAKGEMGKEIAKVLGVHESEVIHVLPSGSFSIVEE
jgi:predicted ribosome quality control (RQC) complex YloA/Tae2 family protein